jgi:hypothetical protein
MGRRLKQRPHKEKYTATTEKSGGENMTDEMKKTDKGFCIQGILPQDCRADPGSTGR